MHTNTGERSESDSDSRATRVGAQTCCAHSGNGRDKIAPLQVRRALAVGLLVLAITTPAQAWWNSEWTLRKQITLDPSAAGLAPADATGPVPVLVRFSDGNFRFASAQSDGSDLRFIAADDKTPLTFHIEKFDPLLNEAIVWVKIPDLKPGTKTTFWLYYGNTTAKLTKADDAKGTYDADTVLVYHFAEHGQPAADSSGNGNNALNAGTPSDGAMIGSGLRLDGKSGIAIPASPTLAMPGRGPLTWSAWIKYGAPQPNAVVFSHRDTFGSLVMGVDSGVPFVEITSGNIVQRSPAGAPLTAGGWRHLAMVAAPQSVTLYVDGVAYATLNASLPAASTSALIGGVGTGGVGYAGEIDELEISRVARPASLIKLAAFSQGADSAGKFISFGEDEQETNWLSGLKNGYIGVIVSSLTPDGWAVICILAIMFVISCTVMVRKAAYLNRTTRGNAEFLEQWKSLSNDLSVLDNGDASQARTMGGAFAAGGRRNPRNSPLYQIYHVGVEEIQLRLSADRSGGTKILSARSIEAIRAALDGGLVRETQKLNSQMVLLTIAISGGPFLGLLGTVIGVMITFAAVAQAGDVNVNAIAPGIAAALAATVAGLFVAIPSLFGYNYLLTKIKAVTSDIHVFIDEFITKLAEFYSEPPAESDTLPLEFDEEGTEKR
jgi:biopolymer transport protein ExbB